MCHIEPSQLNGYVGAQMDTVPKGNKHKQILQEYKIDSEIATSIFIFIYGQEEVKN